MTRKFQLQHKLPIRRKEQAWEMTTIDGKPIDELIYLETLPLQMNFENHLENIIFDIYPEGAYDIILGIPWLRAHNPEISWDTEDIDFTRCRCPREKPRCAPRAVDTLEWFQRLGFLHDSAHSSQQQDSSQRNHTYQGIEIETLTHKQMKKHINHYRQRVYACII